MDRSHSTSFHVRPGSHCAAMYCASADPARFAAVMRRRVRCWKIAELEMRRHAERVPAIAFARAGERRVDREAQRAEPGGDRAVHQLARDLPVAVDVELKPARTAARRARDRLEAHVRHRARAEDGAFRSRRRAPSRPRSRRDTARGTPLAPRAPETTPACPGPSSRACALPTPRSMRGSSWRRLHAARFSASVHSSAAPPAM